MNELESPFGFCIKELLKKKGWIEIPSSGCSMFPFIKEGDICRFTSLDNKLTKGDVLLYHSESCHLIGHRYFYSYVEDQVLYHILQGDTNSLPDPPVKDSQLIGKLTWVRKGNWRLHAQGLLAKGWGIVVLRHPMIPRVLRDFRSFKSKAGFGIRGRMHEKI